ncbi:MAG: TIGR03364 family FAD-dependent oxidoreductase [Chitinophagales bacterium]|nr:TIGR03364 family FAD-dependent oxidoreductase [Chitinophagales bacterium]MDW8273081.1 TIGR03364 family FAD-dependent oxidoreductase [Chitinophagales bacterium]
MKKGIVVGAGIVGLACARALAERGYHVTVLERNSWANGASVRNFGMVWPIGQPTGPLLERAMRSRSIWKTLCEEGKIWYEETGSLLAAQHEDEMQVIEEFVSLNKMHRHCEILNPENACEKSSALKRDALLGALWSDSEIIVDPREALAKLPELMKDKYQINFLFGKCVSHVAYPKVFCGREVFDADVIAICSGYDFETLYPESFSRQKITKCKLQMLRTKAQPKGWRMGAALCAGLTLIHYSSFKECPSLPALKKRYEKELPEYIQWGIHVMASQQGSGEVTLGDSHEYGDTFDPFDKSFINDLILEYLDGFTQFPTRHIAQTWNGIYAKMHDGSTELILRPEDGVWIINGLGGAGMTLSFGLAEEVVARI